MPPDQLNGRDLSSLRPTDRPAKYGDGMGLYLLVKPSGSKLWRFRYRYAGKQNTLSCGAYPAVSLEQARARRDRFRALLAGGADPSSHAKAERASQLQAQCAQQSATRFLLDNRGGLSVQFGSRHILLSGTETAELRTFLDATRAVTPEV